MASCPCSQFIPACSQGLCLHFQGKQAAVQHGHTLSQQCCWRGCGGRAFEPPPLARAIHPARCPVCLLCLPACCSVLCCSACLLFCAVLLCLPAVLCCTALPACLLFCARLLPGAGSGDDGYFHHE